MSLDGMVLGNYGQQVVLTIYDIDNPTVIVPIDGYSSFFMEFKDPSGDVTTKTAAQYTDGTDGAVAYTTVDGDIDDDGLWYVRAKAVSGSSVLFSQWESFEVER